MSLLKDINRKVCQDFCDHAGRDDDYAQAWTYGILLDIVIPIISLVSGLVIGFGTVIATIITLRLGLFVIIPLLIIFHLIYLIIVLLIIYLLAREIGIFILIPLVMELAITILSSISDVGWVFMPLAFVPWYLIAILAHMICYRGLTPKTTVNS